jgi:sugar lactone lactonase YvrE
MFAGHSMLCSYEENGEEQNKERLVRRLLVFCAVAGALLAAYAVAQNGSAGAQSGSDAALAAQSKRGPSTACASVFAETANTKRVEPAHSAQDDGVAGCAAAVAGSGIPANARVVATAVAARALALDFLAPEYGGHLYLTLATSPNIVTALQTNGMQSVSSALSGAPMDAFAPTKKSLLLVTSVAGTGQAGSLGDGGAAISAQLDLAADSFVERSGIAVAADGTIFIADTRNGTIRSVGGAASSEPGVIRSVAGRWAGRQNIALAQPMGIAVDRGGNLYIADYSAGAVDVLAAATGQLSTLAQVISPGSVAVTPDGKQVFVASPATGAVFAIATGTRAIAAVSGFAPQSASAPAAGPCANVGGSPAASAGAAACPAGLAADARGNLFVADASGGKIIRVDAKTGKSSTIASGLSVPGELALDAKGNLYVAEQGANRVLVLPDVTANSGNITLTAPAAFAAPCPQTTDPFTYCNMPSGGTSPAATFTLTNTSATTAATAVAISVTSADFTVVTKSCTVTLPASGTCTIGVAFTPKASGARAGTLTVTDSAAGDSATYDLAGTGDDYALQLASGQPTEVSIPQGGTATFKAEVAPDSVFGQNGEMVKFQCPSNVPAFATCAFSPCPVAITPGTPVAFNVTFVTSSALVSAPTVANPCGGGSSGVGPGARRNPTLFLRAAPGRLAAGAGGRFPAPWWLALAAIFGGAALVVGGVWFRGGLGGTWPVFWRRMGRITPSIGAGHDVSCPYDGRDLRSRSLRARIIFALAGVAVVALLMGCHNNSQVPAGVVSVPSTPVAITNMTILANATDASGNSLGTSRSLEIILDVVK